MACEGESSADACACGSWGGSQRRPQKRLDRRLEGVVKAVGGGYCRLQMPLKPALGVRETVAGRRLGALDGGGGGGFPPPPLQCIPLGEGGFAQAIRIRARLMRASAQTTANAVPQRCGRPRSHTFATRFRFLGCGVWLVARQRQVGLGPNAFPRRVFGPLAGDGGHRAGCHRLRDIRFNP